MMIRHSGLLFEPPCMYVEFLLKCALLLAFRNSILAKDKSTLHVAKCNPRQARICGDKLEMGLSHKPRMERRQPKPNQILDL